MNLRILLACLLAVLCSVLGGCGTEATPTLAPVLDIPTATPFPPNAIIIRVPESNVPPGQYRDADGNLTGLDVEIARAIVEEAGFIPVFVGTPWSRGLEYMKTGEVHLILNANQTLERSEYMNWIGPERTSRMVLAVRQEDLAMPINSIEDFATVAAARNSRFGTKPDTFYSDEFNARLEDPDFARWFDPVADEALNPGKVVAGRTLGWIQDEAYIKYVIANNPDYAGLAIHPFALNQTDVYIGVSKAGVSTENFARLQAAFQRLEDNGVLEEIRNREWK